MFSVAQPSPTAAAIASTATSFLDFSGRMVGQVATIMTNAVAPKPRRISRPRNFRMNQPDPSTVVRPSSSTSRAIICARLARVTWPLATLSAYSPSMYLF